MTVSPLIVTKLLVPPVRPGYVVRPRLNARLARGLAVPLTLVSAPPGFGKTTAMAAWLAERNSTLGQAGADEAGDESGGATATAWLMLDEHDNEAGRFWRYLVAAIQRALPTVGVTAGAMLAQPQPPESETIVAALVNELVAQPTALVLVLDDYHVIEVPTLHAGLAALLDRAPDVLHVYLLTRADPPLGLARRRANGLLAEVRAADLTFTAGETDSFLRQRMGLDLPGPAAATLAVRMDGWIAGIQLAALSLPSQGDPTAYLATHAADDPLIADYLLEEVLRRQPPAVQAFLLYTAICDRLCDALCAAILGDGPSAPLRTLPVSLEHLERANLFVTPLEPTHTWYRYHPIFANLLRRRLRTQVEPGEVVALHLRAADWFAASGDLAGAVHHALQAGAFDRIAAWLEAHAGTMFANSQLPELVRWLKLLPSSLLDKRPLLNMIAAWATLATGDFDAALRYVAAAERSLPAATPPGVTPELADLEFGVVRMQVDFQRAQLGALRATAERLARALASLAPQQVCLFNTAESLLPVVDYDLAVLHAHAGDAATAQRLFGAAAEAARARHNLHLALLCLGGLAQLQAGCGSLHAALATSEAALALAGTGPAASPLSSHVRAELGQLCYEWNRLDEAAAHFEAGAALAQTWHNWEGLAPCTLGLARLCRLARQEDAGQMLRQLLATYPELPPGTRSEVQAWERLWSIEDDEPGVAVLPVEPAPGEAAEAYALVACRVLLAAGRAAEAIPPLTHLARNAGEGGRLRRVAAASVLLAQAYAAAGDEAEAMRHVNFALRLTEPERYCRLWLEAGPVVHALLAQRRLELANSPEPRDRLLAHYAGELLAARPPATATAAAAPPGAKLSVEGNAALIEPLSPRELEVLQLLAAGLSNQEIGSRLVVALTTVKTHVAAVYRKLDVANRTQAVARARQLGLL